MTLNTLISIETYYYIAVFATILFAIKLALFTITGGDGSEVVADFNSEVDTDVSFNFISVQSILAFLMGFGWMGFAGLKQFEFGQIQNLSVAVVVGFLFMLITSGLMFFVKKLEKNVKKDINTALNKIGKAYTKFDPHASGQIEIEINEQLMVVDAINDSDEDINAFEEVKVIKIENNKLYIEKL